MAIDRKYEHAIYNIGNTLDHLGNYTGATVYLNKALAINPKDKAALYHEGFLLDRLGNHTGAIEYYNKARVIK